MTRQDTKSAKGKPEIFSYRRDAQACTERETEGMIQTRPSLVLLAPWRFNACLGSSLCSPRLWGSWLGFNRECATRRRPGFEPACDPQPPRVDRQRRIHTARAGQYAAI